MYKELIIREKEKDIIKQFWDKYLCLDNNNIYIDENDREILKKYILEIGNLEKELLYDKYLKNIEFDFELNFKEIDIGLYFVKIL